MLGKKLKILHVGNIVQNAYVNASILNQRGHDCDVAAFDWYHFASSPEWYHLSEADADLDQLADHYFPDFYALGKVLPRIADWVAHGPQINVLTYLNLRRKNDPLAALARDALAYLRFKATVFRTTTPQIVDYPERQFQEHLGRYNLPDWIGRRIVSGRIHDRLVSSIKVRLLQFQTRDAVLKLCPPFPTGFLDAAGQYDLQFAAMLKALRRNRLSEALGVEFIGQDASCALPDMPGILAADLAPYAAYVRQWADLARHYDVCLFYGDSSVYASVARISEYCAFEIGTIRVIPFENTAYGRLVRHAYQGAAKVFITNTDYITASPRLEFRADQRVFVAHPFDEASTDAFLAQRKDAAPSGPIVFFCPARQDWVSRDPKMAKGNDLYFRAAARLVAAGTTNIRLHCIDWGVDMQATRNLVRELMLENFVVWLKPMSKKRLWKEMTDSAAVADQFLISVMSGIAFEALALGRRLITKDDGVTNSTFFGEAPPILSAGTVDEVEARMRQVMADPGDSGGVGAKAIGWIRRRHSADQIVKVQMAAFADLHSRRDQQDSRRLLAEC